MHDEDIKEIVSLTPALRRYARVLTRYNIDEADDLVQDTLERAFERGDRQYSHGTNLKAWLMRILHNRFLDLKRKSAIQAQNHEEMRLDDSRGQAPPDAFNSFVAFKELISAFEDLPDIYRRSLFLIAVEQLSHEEASAILDIPVGTVKSRVARARSSLKADIDLGEKNFRRLENGKQKKEDWDKFLTPDHHLKL